MRAWPAAATLPGQCADALLGSFKVHNVATVGGNICLSLPAGPMISLAAALDGTATIWAGDGARRQVPVADFVTGERANVLRPGDLLPARCAPPPPAARSRYPRWAARPCCSSAPAPRRARAAIARSS